MKKEYPVLIKDESLTIEQQNSIDDLNMCEVLSESDCIVMSNRGDVSEDDIVSEFEDVKNLTTFTTFYIYNILSNSSVAKRKKAPIYDFDIQTEIDFQTQRVNINAYIDDAVFGLVVGRGFKTSQNFITAIHPIMAKMSDYVHRVKFFPYSDLD